MAEAVVAISQAEGLAARGATAAKRMQRLPATWEPESAVRLAGGKGNLK